MSILTLSRNASKNFFRYSKPSCSFIDMLLQIYNICLADKSIFVTPIDKRFVTISLAQRNLLIYKPGVESVNIIRDNLYQKLSISRANVPCRAHQNYIEVSVPLNF